MSPGLRVLLSRYQRPPIPWTANARRPASQVDIALIGNAAACTRKLQQLLTGRPPKHPPGNGTQALSMHRCCQRHSTINSRQHPVLDDVVSSAWGVERSHQRVGRIVDPRSEEPPSEIQSLMRTT